MNGRDDESEVWNVIVIGAGAAGLQCAQTLSKYNMDKVLVVEAMDYVGGRIKQASNIIPGKTIELGAEFIHGDQTSLMEMAKENHWPLQEVFTWAQGDGGPSERCQDGGIGYYYLGDQLRLLDSESNDKEFIELNETLWKLGADNPDINLDKRSLLEYLQDENISDSMIALAEAGYANTAGSTCRKISYAMSSQYERWWEAQDGDGDFRVKTTFCHLIQLLSRDLTIRRNWAVQRLEHSKDIITLYSKTGEILRTKRVVVTVSLPVLDQLNFIPPLSDEKRKAIQSYGMGNAVKLILRFNKRFWPTNCHGVICSFSFVPEFWIHDPSDNQTFALVGFATDDFADRIVQASDPIERFLQQLDEMFQHQATGSFITGCLHEWGSYPFIQGGYTYPRPGITSSASAVLCESINDRIFFAGEATANGRPGMTIHSAMDTGKRAAVEILSSVSGFGLSRL